MGDSLLVDWPWGPMASLLRDKIKIYKKNYQAEKQICERLLTVPIKHNLLYNYGDEKNEYYLF